ncbi:DegT/DnrJ/EryC1/StrS aminotransferase family protein [uncultured Tateyamaria sp.]|uniref:DegT/DnrJ/EryC1/StrS family aminotransferase n=1 Tax=uncultured Tateyamaria sp. TaxID=455651 RepID=UPI00260BE2E5|nr:DegT/DnrJ/EryC1/StrS family aminotransferase [uncultured Tateyamaria sp.]
MTSHPPLDTATDSEPTSKRTIPQVMPWLAAEEEEAVAAVMRSGWLTEGQVTRAFGERLNQLTGAPYGVFAPNGTLALALGLLALGIGAGDEVLVPDSTFIGSATAVLLVGAHPVFIDVREESFQFDVEAARARLSPKTRALMPVHLFGSPCDMREVCKFASEHGLRVIEDAAQGIAVHFDGRHVGAIGDVGCFSFFADKTITTGEGGYVTCQDPEIYERLCYLRNQGRIDRGSFVHPAIGFNFRITDLQAAIGMAQLDRLDTIVARKRAVYGRYVDQLNTLPQVRFLKSHPLGDHVPFRVVLLVERSQELMAWLADRGVQIRSFFHPLHSQPCFAGHPDAHRMFPVADRGYADGICLPVHPTLADDEVDYICERIHEFYRRVPGSGVSC